jgi:hypothetical protein
MSCKKILALVPGVLPVFVCIIIGCASTQPMTQKVEEKAAAVGDVKSFQYYVSRNIVLTRSEDPVISARVTTGVIEVTHTKQIIQIASSTGGELLNTELDPETGYTIFYVAFETENDNCLRFEQRGPGVDEKVYLVYDDLETYAINYGGVAYIVDWGAGEGLQARTDNLFGKVKGKVQGVNTDDADQPYLLVKMNEKITEKEDYRKASGRKAGG